MLRLCKDSGGRPRAAWDTGAVMAKQTGRTLIASNKKARHDYEILETYECGVALQGTEVKSLRAGRASLVDGYATIDDGEAWLRGVHIAE